MRPVAVKNSPTQNITALNPANGGTRHARFLFSVGVPDRHSRLNAGVPSRGAKYSCARPGAFQQANRKAPISALQTGAGVWARSSMNKRPDLDDEDREAVRPQAIAALNLTQKRSGASGRRREERQHRLERRHSKIGDGCSRTRYRSDRPDQSVRPPAIGFSCRLPSLTRRSSGSRTGALKHRTD